jgi:hypothetical protein
MNSVMATPKQILYIKKLMEWAEDRGELITVLHEINPDLGEEEDFDDWIKRQSIGRASEVIDILKEVIGQI